MSGNAQDRCLMTMLVGFTTWLHRSYGKDCVNLCSHASGRSEHHLVKGAANLSLTGSGDSHLAAAASSFRQSGQSFCCKAHAAWLLVLGVKAPFGKVEALQLHGHLKMASLHLVLANFQAKVLV